MIIGLCGLAGSGKDTVADFLVKDHGFVKIALADPLKRVCKEVFAFTDEQLWGPSDMRNAPDERFLQRGAQTSWLCTKCCEELLGKQFEEKSIGAVLADRDCPNCKKRMAAHDQHLVSLPAKFLTPRFALQQLGTEWGRNCYPNVWVDYALRIAKRVLEGGYYSAQKGFTEDHLWAAKAAYELSAERYKGVVISDVRFKNEVDAIKKAGGIVWRIDRPGAGLTGVAAQHVSETEQLSIPPELFNVIIYNNGSLEGLRAETRTLYETTKALIE